MRCSRLIECDGGFAPSCMGPGVSLILLRLLVVSSCQSSLFRFSLDFFAKSKPRLRLLQTLRVR